MDYYRQPTPAAFAPGNAMPWAPYAASPAVWAAPTAMAPAAMPAMHYPQPAAPAAATVPPMDPALLRQMQRAMQQAVVNNDAWQSSAGGAATASSPTQPASGLPEATAAPAPGESLLEALNPMKDMTAWHYAIAPVMGLGVTYGLEHLMAAGDRQSFDRMVRVAHKLDRAWGVRHASDVLQNRLITPLQQHGTRVAATGWGQTLQSLLHTLPPAQEEARILKAHIATLEKRLSPQAFAQFQKAASVQQLQALVDGIGPKDPLRKLLGAFIKRFDFLKSNHLPSYTRRYALQQELVKKGVGPIGRALAAVSETLRLVASGSTIGLKTPGLFAPLMLGLMSFGPAIANASKAESFWEGVKTFAHEFMGGIVGNFLGWQLGRYLLDKTTLVPRLLGRAANWTAFRFPFAQFGRSSLAGFVTEMAAMFVFGSVIQSGFEWVSHKIFGKPKTVINAEREAQGLPPLPGPGLTHPGGFEAFAQGAAPANAAGNPAAATLSSARSSGPSAGEDISWMKRNPWTNRDADQAKSLEASLPPLKL